MFTFLDCLVKLKFSKGLVVSLVGSGGFKRTHLGLLGRVQGCLEDSHCCLIASLLLRNQTLLSLYLPSNSISDRGAAAMTQAIASNTTLTNLSLSGNQIGSSASEGLRRVWGSREGSIHL